MYSTRNRIVVYAGLAILALVLLLFIGPPILRFLGGLFEDAVISGAPTGELGQ